MDQADAASLVNATFESSGAFLVRYAFRRTRSAALSEDIVQETFLALYRDLRNGKQIHDPRSWALGAVRNQVCKHARDRARHGEKLLSTDQLDLMPNNQIQEAYPGEEASMPSLFSVLTPREEEVISLRLQSLKYREIGDALGISSKSVSTLLTRAIRKLQSVSGRRVASPPGPVVADREVPHAL